MSFVVCVPKTLPDTTVDDAVNEDSATSDMYALNVAAVESCGAMILRADEYRIVFAGGVGGADSVVVDFVKEKLLKLPHPSNALIRVEYDVAGKSPVWVYVLGDGAVVLAMAASKYTLYPVIAVSSNA